MNEQNSNLNSGLEQNGFLENQLRQIQPSMPEALQNCEREIQFELGYQAGKASARKWQYSVWILALITVSSWMAPGIMDRMKPSDSMAMHSAESLDVADESLSPVQNENVVESDIKDQPSIGDQPKFKPTIIKAENTQTIPSLFSFNLFDLMQHLNPSRNMHSTGAYSEYRERAMIIGTDALPEFKMASRAPANEDTAQDGERTNIKWFNQVKWSYLSL
jgi:hypothetical protein